MNTLLEPLTIGPRPDPLVKSQVSSTKPSGSTKKRTTEEMQRSGLPASIYTQTPDEQDQAISDAVQKLDAVPQVIRDRLGKTMYPRGPAMKHEAAPLLNYWAEHGCPVDCGEDWSDEWIEAAIRRGPHISAKQPQAVKALRQETMDKIKSGYARKIKWGVLRKNRPKKLKISPVAAIPHKSRLFRTILDLSFRLKYKGKKLPSVNSASKLLAPAEAMTQLGHCINRIIHTLATNYDPENPFLFAKLDIKDGFWRMAVSDDDAWNFCYVMPTEEPLTNLDDAEIIVPNSLQMGWAESPLLEMLWTSYWKKSAYQNTLLRSKCWPRPTRSNAYKQLLLQQILWRYSLMTFALLPTTTPENTWNTSPEHFYWGFIRFSHHQQLVATRVKNQSRKRKWQKEKESGTQPRRC